VLPCASYANSVELSPSATGFRPVNGAATPFTVADDEPWLTVMGVGMSPKMPTAGRFL
jgi:hypothetical protein